MDELNEQIDSILENSLDEYVKASDWKGYAKPGLARDKEEEEAAKKAAEEEAAKKADADKAAEEEDEPFYQIKGEKCGDYVAKKSEYLEDEGLPPKVARDEAIAKAKGGE